MSFPALAIAAAAVAEVHRYTGISPAFIRSLDIRATHLDSETGGPVFEARADCVTFGFIETGEDGHPVGIHDHGDRP